MASIPDNIGRPVPGDPPSPGDSGTLSSNGAFWISCAGSKGAVAGGPVDATWGFGLELVEPARIDPCFDETLAPGIKAQTVRLRVVGEDEFWAYIAEHTDLTRVTGDPSGFPTTSVLRPEGSGS